MSPAVTTLGTVHDAPSVSFTTPVRASVNCVRGERHFVGDEALTLEDAVPTVSAPRSVDAAAVTAGAALDVEPSAAVLVADPFEAEPPQPLGNMASADRMSTKEILFIAVRPFP